MNLSFHAHVNITPTQSVAYACGAAIWWSSMRCKQVHVVEESIRWIHDTSWAMVRCIWSRWTIGGSKVWGPPRLVQKYRWQGVGYWAWMTDGRLFAIWKGYDVEIAVIKTNQSRYSGLKSMVLLKASGQYLLHLRLEYLALNHRKLCWKQQVLFSPLVFIYVYDRHTQGRGSFAYSLSTVQMSTIKSAPGGVIGLIFM